MKNKIEDVKKALSNLAETERDRKSRGNIIKTVTVPVEAYRSMLEDMKELMGDANFSASRQQAFRSAMGRIRALIQRADSVFKHADLPAGLHEAAELMVKARTIAEAAMKGEEA